MNAGGTVCESNVVLTPGKHNLSMELGLEDISFDGFLYTPTRYPVSNADLGYAAIDTSSNRSSKNLTGVGSNKNDGSIADSSSQHQTTTLKVPGDMWQFKFDGAKLFLYSDAINLD